MMSRFFKNFALSLFLIFLVVFPAQAAEPVKQTLANGLDVLLIENHRAPVVSMMVYVKVGSVSEGPDEIGLAHLMEHMLFKGTTRRGPGEIAREVEAAGGRVNAFTSFDQTVFYIDMAGRFAARGLDILGDMVFNPTLAPEEFSREKEVVIEEIRRGEDMPDRKLSQALFAQAFQVHPYGRPVIGFVSSVRNISRETAVDFHRRWYKPRNMILVVAGDFRPAEVQPLIEQIFGRVPDKPIPVHDCQAEPPQEQTRAVILRSGVKTARLGLGLHVPEFKSEDVPALDLLAVILGQGRTSRLYRRVKREKELVHSISAGAYTPKDPGLFVINAQLEPDMAGPAIKAVMTEVSALGATKVTSDELARAKLNIRADFIHSRVTMSGEARTAAYYEALADDFRAKDRYLADLDQVTAADLKAVAARYFKLENLTVAVMVPQAAAPGLTEDMLSAAAADGAKAAASISRPVSDSAVVKYRLANGATLLVKADDSLPLVAVRAAFLGGLRYENAQNNGLNNFLAQVWDRSTSGFSAEELARAVEDMAGDISAFSGRNSFGLEAEFLSRYLDQGLKLFAEVLTRPAWDPSEVEKARSNILAAIKRRQDILTARTFQLFTKTLYNGHPYGRKVSGTPETVKRISAQDLRRYYKKWARPSNMVLAVAGDVNPERIKTRLERLLKGWSGQVLRKPVIPGPKALQGLKKGREVIERAQAHQVLGFLAPGLAGPDRFALEVLDTVLSGQGGRMFIELRDKQSLAYALSSFYRPGLGTGSFGLYIAFDPSKTGRVRAGLKDILSGVTDQPISREELDRAKENILGTYEIGLQSYSAQVSELVFNELYGLGYDYRRRYLAGISAVTVQDVQRAARKYLDLGRAAEVTVGMVKD